MRSSYSFTQLAMAGMLAVAAPSLGAQSILLNGSFEDSNGSFNNWNQSLAASGSYLSIDDGTSTLFIPHDGSFYALFAASGGQADAIDQVLATTPGLSYTIAFWVNDKYGGSDLVANWGAAQLLHLADSYNSGQGNNGWAEFSFVLPATDATTDLSFASFSNAALGLDAITVTPAPEAAQSAVVAGLGLLLVAAWRRSGAARR